MLITVNGRRVFNMAALAAVFQLILSDECFENRSPKILRVYERAQ
jgi:hypothetical protein